MADWADQLRDDLRVLEARRLLRSLSPSVPHGRFVWRAGRDLVNLASNDYLGLAQHPRLKDSVIEATRTFGIGSTASRLLAGHLPVHERVEKRFARFKHAEAALLCSTGYMANHAVLTALAGKDDLVCVDKFSHASLLDAARASGATVRVYPHLHFVKLERLLSRSSTRRRFIVTDSVFSMDGDTAELPALCDMAQRYEAILIVDEAHATGVLGETGAGLVEAQNAYDRVDVVVSTASKALGGLGGIVTARRIVIDTLINRARSFIYTTASPPAQAAAVEAALDVIRDEPWRRRRLAELAAWMRAELGSTGLLPPSLNTAGIPTPIIPILTGTVYATAALSRHLEGESFFVPAIHPPTVRPGTSRVRISLRADLKDGEIERLCAALKAWHRRGLISAPPGPQG